MAEIIQLTATSRLLVEQDTDAAPPRGGAWGSLTGFAKLGSYGDSRRTDVPAVHAPPFDLAQLFYKLQNRREFVGYTDIMYRRRIEDVDLVGRLAWMFYGLHVVFDWDHGGWWFVDLEKGRENFLLAADAQIPREDQMSVIADERAVYEQWAEGGVYGVVLQRQNRYVKVISTGEVHPPERVDWDAVIEQWDDVVDDDGALWGCYLDEEYTAQAVALEHFALTSDEEAAARGAFPPGELDAEQ